MKVAAILLAAGRSERMGAFKPLLPWGQTSVIESCIDYLRRGGLETIVIVLGHRADDVRAGLQHLPVRFTTNPDPNSEMGASLACGVRELSAETNGVIIALTDHPAVQAEVVARLIEQWRQTGAKLLVPEFAGHGGHPVLVDLCYRDELLSLDPAEGLRGLFRAHRRELRRVPVESPYVARDIDTCDDYRTLHKDVFGSEPLASRNS
jgi:molybdenum cofactor cytidylyltransferase